jgi:hypothetical protein
VQRWRQRDGGRLAAGASEQPPIPVTAGDPVAGPYATPVGLAGEPGDSLEQREAETVMIGLLSTRLGIELRPERVKLPAGGWLQLDGYSAAPLVACEAWAHQGEAKSAQKDKVTKDILKLMFVRSFLGDDTKLVLLFSDEAAAKFLRGRSWRGQAMKTLGIEIEMVDLPPDVREKVVLAQQRQYR